MIVKKYDAYIDGIYYKLSGDEATVTNCINLPDDISFNEESNAVYQHIIFPNYQGCYSGIIVIPCLIIYNGKKYKVTSIDERAFEYCSNLKSVSIPDSVISIGVDAFSNCSSLLYNEYDGVRYLGNKENPFYALIEPKSKDIVKCTINTKCKVISNYAWGHSRLSSIIFPDGMKSIGAYAFYECIALTSVNIPDSVISIGDFSFSGCSGLTSAAISKGLLIIGAYAFYECKVLTSIIIPSGLTSIGDFAFSGCESLTSMEISDSVSTIGNGVFSGCI